MGPWSDEFAPNGHVDCLRHPIAHSQHLVQAARQDKGWVGAPGNTAILLRPGFAGGMKDEAMRLWLLACAAALTIQTAFAAASDVDQPTRDRVEESLASVFVRPQTAIWRFDDYKPYVDGDHVVCGAVNFQSAQQHYLGFHQFYAIIHDHGVTLAQIADPMADTSGKLSEKLMELCGKA